MCSVSRLTEATVASRAQHPQGQARTRAVLLELRRRPLGFRIRSHFPVELRHSTNGPRRADVTAVEASGRTAREGGGARRG
jgi:hypothetical protein